MAELSIEIAGVRTGILTRDPEVAGVVRERYRGFLSAGPPGWRIELNAAAAPRPSSAGAVVDQPSIVRLHGSQAGCYGTPFWGELARGGEDRSAALVGIYVLHKAGRHAVEAIRSRQALARLLPNLLFFAREPELTSQVLEISADLVEAVPCFEFAFLPDAGFWKVIEDA